MKNRIILSAIILLSLSTSINAQIRSEVALGAKYLGKAPFLLFDREFPMAPELGVGNNCNDKWYYGISSCFYALEGIYDEHQWRARFTSLELNFRRSFTIEQLPKVIPFITAKPGIMLCSFSTEDVTSTDSNSTLISTSIGVGLSYKITNKSTVYLSPGFSRNVNKNKFFNFGQNGASSFVLDLGITYEF